MNFRIIFNIWDFLLPSHGGSDTGAISGNLREKDFTLQAANYMTRRLQELGISVVSIKTANEDRKIKKIK